MAATLSGRLVLVTGAASGIGKGVCELFARHGASVIGADLQETVHQVMDTLDVNENAKHSAFRLDLTNEKNVSEMMNDIFKQYDRVPTIAVNSAGKDTKGTFLLQISGEDFSKTLDINLKSTFLVTKHVCDHMIKNKVSNGSIVNMSSIAGKMGSFVGQAGYASSKAGIIGFTKTVAQEMARHNIRCNVVLPGFIETPMTEEFSQELVEQLKTMVPLGRTGQPEDIAEACLFLASDKSSYITGNSIEVAGGLFA